MCVPVACALLVCPAVRSRPPLFYERPFVCLCVTHTHCTVKADRLAGGARRSCASPVDSTAKPVRDNGAAAAASRLRAAQRRQRFQSAVSCASVARGARARSMAKATKAKSTKASALKLSAAAAVLAINARLGRHSLRTSFQRAGGSVFAQPTKAAHSTASPECPNAGGAVHGEHRGTLRGRAGRAESPHGKAARLRQSCPIQGWHSSL